MEIINKIGHIDKCQICSSKNLEIMLSLGHHALISSYLAKEDLNRSEKFYPLNFCRCAECGLLQLDYIVDPKEAFHPAYPYHTGMTNMLIKNFRALAKKIIDNYKLQKDDLVIDIGSNDGTLLKGFQQAGMRVLGVEPTNAAQAANNNGITTMQDFFNSEVAQRIAREYGSAKIITCTNAFAHINALYDVIEGIKTLLDQDGIFVSESQYLGSTIKKTQFDCIYHEHLRYYSIKPMQKMFSLSSMSIVDAEIISAAGGSIRVCAKKGIFEPSARVKQIISMEEKMGLYDKEKLKTFSQKANIAKTKLLSLAASIKDANKKLVGIGSPARSNTLLSFSGINNHIMDYACERKGSPKIGLFTPGTHIPVVDEEILFREQPEYALMLSWHIGDELMEKLRELGFKGKFIVPLPEPKIITYI